MKLIIGAFLSLRLPQGYFITSCRGGLTLTESIFESSIQSLGIPPAYTTTFRCFQVRQAYESSTTAIVMLPTQPHVQALKQE